MDGGLSQNFSGESIVGESPSTSTDEPLREVPVEDIPAAPWKRKFTSEVWNYFIRETVVDPKKGGIPIIKAKCKRCHAMLGGNPKNGTTHLKHHLDRCPRKHVRVDVDQQLLKAASSTSMDGSITLENYKFNQENSRKELVNMIVFHEHPLSIVDQLGFRIFVLSLNPLFKIISRNTLKSDVLRIFESEKLSLKKFLQRLKCRVAITTDMWTTSNQRKGYMAITAHFIDDDWTLRSRLLRFLYVPCPHTKDAIAKVLVVALFEYNLERMISSITLDNCTTNDGVMDLLREKLDPYSLILGGQLLHMRCGPHVINLIVKDGLEVIGDGIERVRDCIAFWTSTPKRVEKFEDSKRSLAINCNKKLALDCKTRWNSTFLMLQSALPYKTVFSRLQRLNPTMKFVLPTAMDWDVAKDICDRLKMFYKVTELFSGRHYPTLNLFFRKICEIKLTLNSWLLESDVMIVTMTRKMIDKFDKYWRDIHGLLTVACILDPRYKLECVEFYYNKLYGSGATYEIEKVKQLCYDLLS